MNNGVLREQGRVVITVCTHACITCGIAHAFYGPLPEQITRIACSILDDRLGEVTREFMIAFVDANSD